MFDFSFHLATKYTFWSGVIGGAFLTMASHGTDQTIVQRLLAARDQRDSRRALLASGVIVLVQFTVFLLIGVLLFVFAQHTATACRRRTDRSDSAIVSGARNARGLGGLVAGVDFGRGDVQCERFAQFPGGLEHRGFFAAARAFRGSAEVSCSFAPDDAWFGDWC